MYNQNLSINIQRFYSYCNEFYNDRFGIYPIATEIEIIRAVDKYIYSHNLRDIEFDSIDRERVRKILQPNHDFFIK